MKFTSQQLEAATPLSDSEATLFRQVVSKLLHVQDGYPDSQDVIKEVSREMSKPTSTGMVLLKHCARYMETTVDNCILIKPVVGEAAVEIRVDSNWSGCAKTAKSPDCLQVCMAGVLVHCSSKTRAVIAVARLS